MLWRKIEPLLQTVESRKILIAGLGKSGTTILTARISKSWKANHIFLEPEGVQAQSNKVLHQKICSRRGRVICKILIYPERADCLTDIQQKYDQIIWMVRDPRDQMISSFLYAWYAAHGLQASRFEAAVDLVKMKEESPGKISFKSCMETCFNLNTFFQRYQFLLDQIEKATTSQNLSPRCLIVKYEDLIDGNMDALNAFLGFEVDMQIPVYKMAEQVNRTKTYGNWRSWFTEEDVAWMKPHLIPFLKRMNYDATDWKLENRHRLERRYGSEYMTRMYHYKRSKLDIIRGLLDYY